MGFTTDDVERLVKPAKRERGSAVGSDELAELPDDPITQPGDLVELGAHRLICGDSTEPAVIDRLLSNGRVDCVVTDPPYAIYGSSTGLASEVADDKMVRPFFRAALKSAARALIPFGHLYVCCDWRSWSSWWEVCKGTGLAPKNMIVWDKGGSGLGNNYANTHELLFYCAAIPRRTRMTVDNPGQRPVLDTNVWRIARVPSGEERIHNAQKPVELFTRALENSTVPGERVLDLFAGSGTILVAAEQTERVAFVADSDPAWADAAIARWERLTGKKAKRPRRRTPREVASPGGRQS
jgi:DNA modification methylase